MPMEHCTGCGLSIDGGGVGCRARFDELIARDFGNALYFRVHRKMVDTYALQHPDEFCRSAKSMAAHLAGLSWFIDNPAATGAVGPEALQKWLSGRKDLPRPTPPVFRGAITIGDVDLASTPIEYAQAVDRWARSTWDAYAPLHEVARDWLRQAQEVHLKPR